MTADGYLLGGEEFYADGGGDGGEVADLSEFAGGLIDFEDGDVVGSLVAGDDVFAGGVDAEVAGRLAERFLMAGGGELAGFVVDREDGQAVVAAIGAVEEFARGMDLDFGGGIAFGVFGEGGDRLDLCQRALGGVVGIAGDRRRDLIAVV